MFVNIVKTTVLLMALNALLLFVGSMIGGVNGIHMALLFAFITNGIALFFSDKIVLSMYGAQPLDRSQYNWIYEIMQDLSQKLYIPMPKLWLVTTPVAMTTFRIVPLPVSAT